MVDNNEFLEVYNTLIDNGVRFYYSDEDMYLGEITSLELTSDNKLEMEIEFNEIFIVEIDEFLHNHSKENVNYHNWESIRLFDNLLNKKI